MKEFQKEHAADTKEPVWQRKVDNVWPIQYEKTKVFANKLTLNLVSEEVLTKLAGNRKPVYRTPSVTWTKRKTLKREGIVQ